MLPTTLQVMYQATATNSADKERRGQLHYTSLHLMWLALQRCVQMLRYIMYLPAPPPRRSLPAELVSATWSLMDVGKYSVSSMWLTLDIHGIFAQPPYVCILKIRFMSLIRVYAIRDVDALGRIVTLIISRFQNLVIYFWLHLGGSGKKYLKGFEGGICSSVVEFLEILFFQQTLFDYFE